MRFILIILLFIACKAIYSQETRKDAKAKSDFYKAINYLNKKKYKEATKYFILSKTHKNYSENASNLLGVISSINNQYPLNRNRFSDAYIVNNNPNLMYNKILTMLKSNDLKLAENDFSSIENWLDGYRPVYNYGLCLAKLEQTAEAIYQFDKIIQKGKKFENEFMFDYSLALLRKNEINKSILYYNEINRSRIPSHKYLGFLLDIESGKPKLTPPQRLDKENKDLTLFIKAFSALKDSAFTKVQGYMDIAYNNNLQNKYCLLNRSQISLINNEFDASNIFLEKYEEKFFPSYESLNIRGWINLQRKNFEVANNCFQKAYNKSNNPVSVYGLFILSLETKQFNNAVDNFEKLQKEFSYFFLDGRDYFSYGYALLVSTNKKLDKDDIKVLKDYSKVLYFQYLGFYQFNNDLYEKGIKSLQKAVNSSKSTFEKSISYKNLGIAYEQIGDISNSLENFKKAFQIIPDFESCIGISNGYYEKSDFKNAIDFAKEAISLDTSNYLLKVNHISIIKSKAIKDENDSLLRYCLTSEKKILKKIGKGFIESNIGMSFLFLDEIDSAFVYFEKIKSDTISYLNNISITNYLNGKIDEALNQIGKAEKLSKLEGKKGNSVAINKNMNLIKKSKNASHHDFSYFYVYFKPSFDDVYLKQKSKYRFRFYFPFPEYSNFKYDYRVKRIKGLKNIKLKDKNSEVIYF